MSGEAVVIPVIRGASGESAFNPLKVSPSRVNAYLFCGEAFRRKYIEKEKARAVGSAALFGNVFHAGLEKWTLNREQSLVTLVGQAWIEATREAPVVAQFIAEYQAISIECMKAEKAAAEAFEKRNPGKPSKVPRMTKEFKESEAAKKLNRLLARWIPKLNEQSPWRFSERDPLPSLYDESLILAKKYSTKWRYLPTSLHTEFGFNVEWEGYLLNGFIDCIDPALSPEGELVGYEITDYKTYRAEAPAAKDWRQGAIYDICFEALSRSGALPFDPELPRHVVFDYARLLRRKDFEYSEIDRAVLKRDLDMYSTGVKAGVFLPAHKNQNPDFCDFEDCCMRTRGEGTGRRGNRYPEAEE